MTIRPKLMSKINKLVMLLLLHLAPTAAMQMSDEKAREMLGLSSTAPFSDIKKAYHTLAIKYHPDKCKDGETFKKLSSAYKILEKAEENKKSSQWSSMRAKFEPEMQAELLSEKAKWSEEYLTQLTDKQRQDREKNEQEEQIEQEKHKKALAELNTEFLSGLDTWWTTTKLLQARLSTKTRLCQCIVIVYGIILLSAGLYCNPDLFSTTDQVETTEDDHTEEPAVHTDDINPQDG